MLQISSRDFKIQLDRQQIESVLFEEEALYFEKSIFTSGRRL
ncbi:hypothetical protein [Flavobacterium sp. PL12]